jgi:hypothetical protein
MKNRAIQNINDIPVRLTKGMKEKNMVWGKESLE